MVGPFLHLKFENRGTQVLVLFGAVFPIRYGIRKRWVGLGLERYIVRVSRLVAIGLLLSTYCRSQEFSHAVVVASPLADRVETNAVSVLTEEAERRTSIRWITK